MRTAPADKMLSDDEWGQIAWDVMNRTGLCPFGQEDEAVRWVAVRHGEDHIHIVAMLARQDGRRPRVSNDRYRVREACLAAEERYGLRRTAPGDRTAGRRPGGLRRRRQGGLAGKRHLGSRCGGRCMRRRPGRRGKQSSLTGSSRPVCWCGSGGARVDPGQVTGYAVALPGDATAAGKPVWFGGGKLAADLTLPKLRQRWGGAGEPFTAAERSAVWEHAARAADQALRGVLGAAPGAAADVAWAAADTLHAAAAALGAGFSRRRPMRMTERPRCPTAVAPVRTSSGEALRRAARLLAAYGHLADDPSFRPLVLITRLVVLAEAIAGLRDAQGRAAQAAGALRSAERLRAAREFLGGPGSGGRHTAASLAGAGFRCQPIRCRPVRTRRYRSEPGQRRRRLGRDITTEQRTTRRSTMDASEVYPDVLGDAVSYSSQRLAQLGSLITAAATMEIRRRAQASALNAARDEQELKALREHLR